MFHLSCQIPKDIAVAVSGGPDSMALLSFCQAGKKNITVIHVDHGTQHAEEAKKFVKEYCYDNALKLFIYEFPKEQAGNEASWRNYRLDIYKIWTSKFYVATAHHLDDVVEWYLLSAAHGKPKFMKSIDKTNKLIKPFLYTEKSEIINWCNRKKINFVIDPTNFGEYNARAILRGQVIPGLLKINPGMKTSIRRKMFENNG